MSQSEILSTTISVVSLLLAISSGVFAYINRKRDVPFNVASSAYDRYYDMNRIALENPHLTHMFVTFDKYDQIKAIVERSIERLDEPKIASYQLQERAVTDFILSFYEQMLGQWAATQDKEHEFVDAMIGYFEGRLLRNPRLIWWWMAEAGGLETSYEPSTRKRWRERVLEPFKASTANWQDAEGPFKLGRSRAGADTVAAA